MKTSDASIADLFKLVQKLQKEPDTPANNESKANMASNLALLLWKDEKLNQARRFFTIALESYTKIGDELRAASINGALGSLYLSIEEFEMAEHYTKDAYSFWSVKGSSHLNEKLSCLQNFGIIYKNLNQIEKAAENVLKAMELAIKLGDEHEFAKSVQILLEYYESIERYDMLLELKGKSLEFWRFLKIPEREFKTFIDMGVICQLMDNHDDSLMYFKEGFNVAFALGDLEKMYLAQGFVGEAYFKMHDVEKAKKTYIEAYKLAVYIHALQEASGKDQLKISEMANNEQSMQIVLLSLGVTQDEIKKIAEIAINEAKNKK